MKKKDFEEIIKSLVPSFYSFSYILVPDDLQAQQIVVDALMVMALQENDLLQTLLQSSKTPGVPSAMDGHAYSLKKALFKHIFKLGKKRFHQLHESFNFEKSVEGDFGPFYQMDITDRALLFLREKTEFSTSEMAQILGQSESELWGKLMFARGKILKYLGYSLESVLEIS